jgi:hypothetical protein
MFSESVNIVVKDNCFKVRKIRKISPLEKFWGRFHWLFKRKKRASSREI